MLHAGILRNVDSDGARLVLGDFNEWTRGLASQLLSSHFNTADPHLHLDRKHTYPGLLPFLHLDHIYFDSALKLERLTLHRSLRALVASDHLPFVADFTVSDTKAMLAQSMITPDSSVVSSLSGSQRRIRRG